MNNEKGNNRKGQRAPKKRKRKVDDDESTPSSSSHEEELALYDQEAQEPYYEDGVVPWWDVPVYSPNPKKHTTVLMTSDHAAHPMNIDATGTIVSNSKGYRMARASYGVTEGAWYWEAKILSEPPKREPRIAGAKINPKVKPPESHWRLGWSTNLGELQAPVGYDKRSYGYRDIGGVKLHNAQRIPYGEGYKPGDVVGFYISLPQITESSTSNNSNESTKQENNFVDLNSPIKTTTSSTTAMSLKDAKNEYIVLEGSRIIFYLNGVSQGEAFSNLYKGLYYPAVSLYFDATVEVNFGPNFAHPPKDIVYRPMCEAAEIQIRKINDELARISQEDQRLLGVGRSAEVMDVDAPNTNNSNSNSHYFALTTELVQIEDNSGGVGNHIIIEETSYNQRNEFM